MILEEPNIMEHEGQRALDLSMSPVKRVPTLLMAAIDAANEVALNPGEDPGVREQMTRVMPEIATILDRDFGVVR